MNVDFDDNSKKVSVYSLCNSYIMVCPPVRDNPRARGLSRTGGQIMIKLVDYLAQVDKP